MSDKQSGGGRCPDSQLVRLLTLLLWAIQSPHVFRRRARILSAVPRPVLMFFAAQQGAGGSGDQRAGAANP